ncbi:hypothetical protein RI129_005188 [Pyrocoelia pectoralis]|uniref:Pseudouridine-5'-phosphate glycosidase n=1 Tax=Pyrocoelia pectoralis TaxID=417401 RepID=A0AAN7VM90_9COLE
MWRILDKVNSCLNRCANRKISSYINITEEVKYALKNNLPTVALESTIITHGMPFPDNLHCAQEVEGIVRAKGGIPATIAILRGRIKVGLTPSELEELADTNKTNAIKTSRRDFGYVIANKLNGGTTVAGTLIVAKQAGIKVFATGGLGGVHREAEKTFDISADLIELGKSPVAVISSGVKSILDIPKTLEYLETQGVFVATVGSNKDFPAFYCRSSGCKAPYNVTNAAQAANIIKCHFESGLKSEFEMNEAEMNKIIEHAMLSAKSLGISGKEITPYLLTQISVLTEGSSLKTNIAFIKNNARVATEIALELSRLKDDSYGNIQGSGKFERNSNADNPPVCILF